MSTDNLSSFHAKDLTNSFLCCHTIKSDILVFVFLVKWHCHHILNNISFQITMCTNLLPITWVIFLKNSVVGENFGVQRTVVTTYTES